MLIKNVGMSGINHEIRKKINAMKLTEMLTAIAVAMGGSNLSGVPLKSKWFAIGFGNHNSEPNAKTMFAKKVTIKSIRMVALCSTH